jgi:hypothetical protein
MESNYYNTTHVKSFPLASCDHSLLCVTVITTAPWKETLAWHNCWNGRIIRGLPIHSCIIDGGSQHGYLCWIHNLLCTSCKNAWLISSIFDFPDIGEGRVLPLIECKRTSGRLDALMTDWGISSTLWLEPELKLWWHKWIVQQKCFSWSINACKTHWVWAVCGGSQGFCKMQTDGIDKQACQCQALMYKRHDKLTMASTEGRRITHLFQMFPVMQFHVGKEKDQSQH